MKNAVLVLFALVSISAAADTVSVVYPKKGTTDVPVEPTLEWQSLISAVSYDIQVTTDSSFASIGYSEWGVEDVALPLYDLTYNTHYYWRIRGKHKDSSVTPWTPADFTTVPEPPPAPALLSPAADAGGIALKAKLVWSRAARAKGYTIEVSVDELFSDPVVSFDSISDTAVTTPALNPGAVYWWRVKALNAGGESNWSTISNFTTLVPSPEPVGPAPDAQEVALTAKLRWKKVAGADSYELDISSDSAFTSLDLSVQDIYDTVYSVASNVLERGTLYYWRVRALAGVAESAWGVSRFTTIPNVPGAPVLTSPEDGETRVALDPVMQWEQADRAAKYQLQVARDSLFSTLVANIDTIDTLYKRISGLSEGTVYFWRVRASNAGGTGDWSACRKFTTGKPGPVLVSPAHDSTSVATSTVLAWNAAAQALSYDVEVSPDMSFDFPVAMSYAQTGTTFSLTGLDNGTDYYWRVRANFAGEASSWSLRHFRTIHAPPGIPQALLPEEGASSVPVPAIFVWSSSARAAAFTLQIATDSAFANKALDTAGIRDTLCRVASLGYAKSYFWRIRAVNNGGSSAWTPAVRFTTVIAPPAAPQPLLPAANDTIGRDETLVFSWRSPDRTVDLYQIEIAADSIMSSAIIDSVADTTLDAEKLQRYPIVWWRVRARNIGGWGPFSVPRKLFAVTSIAVGRPEKDGMIVRTVHAGRALEFIAPVQGTCMVRVYTLAGRMIASHYLRYGKGANVFSILPLLASEGVYIARIQGNSFSCTMQVWVR